MGIQLVEYYEKASQEFGQLGRVKLALLTSISSTKAANEADSPANLERFEKAITQLRQNGAS